MNGRNKASRAGNARVRSATVALITQDTVEANQVSRLLEGLEAGCLVTYRRVEDLLLNSPRGKVALVILASESSPENVGKALRLIRRNWWTAGLAVVGGPEDRQLEIAARECGASYFARPVQEAEWVAMFEHVLAKAHKLARSL